MSKILLVTGKGKMICFFFMKTYGPNLDFIVIGENIHCSRAIKTASRRLSQATGGGWRLEYADAAGARHLPVPAEIVSGADWAAGRLRHCAAAVWQGLFGQPDDQALALDYIQELARRQAAAGAAYLDLNVDEFNPDIEIRCRAMRWLAATVQTAADLPLSIDSSHPDVLEAGLQVCAARQPPLLNSVSLERLAAVPLAAKYRARVVASAAGAGGIPATPAERAANLEKLTAHLMAAGIAMENIFMDPLVLPVSTDGANPGVTLDTIRALRGKFGAPVHITGGFSNVSFGMPGRRLINLVFTHMALAAGADSGIVDPLQINSAALAGLNPGDAGYILAHNLLTGADDFGADFIAAYRAGQLNAGGR